MPTVAKPKRSPRSPDRYKEIKSMRSQRAALLKKCTDLVNRAEGEKRDMSAEEKEQFNKMYNDTMDLKDRVQKLEEMVDGADEDEEDESEEDDSELDDSEEDDSERSEKRKPGEKRSDFLMRQRSEGNPNKNRGDGKVNVTRRPLETDAEFAIRNRRASKAYIDDALNYLVYGDKHNFRAVQADLDISGGFLVMPELLQNKVLKKVDNLLWMYQLGTVWDVPNAQSMGIPTIDNDPDDADWTSEIATIQADSTMSFGKRALTPFPIRKRILVSERFLRMGMQAAFLSNDDNNGKDATKDSLIINRLAYKIAVPQEKGFMTGNGVNKPLGLFTASSRGISTARDVSTGSATNITYAGLINTKFGVKAQYMKTASWLFHKDMMALIMKLVDSAGRPLLNFATLPDQPDTLLQRPVYLSEYAPNTFTTGLYVGIFGDMSFYGIVRGMDIQIKKAEELYAEKGQVGFFIAAEADGMPLIEEAFARMKTA